MAAAGASSGGGSTGGIRAGRAFVEIFTDDKAFKQGLAGLRGTLNKWGAGLAHAGAIGAGIGGAILGSLGLVAKASLDSASALADMSDRLGVSVEELNALGYAAELAGGSLEEVEKAVGKMQMAISEGKTVGGVNLGGLLDKSLPEQVDAIAEALKGVENPIQRNAIAVEIFGAKIGRKMVPFLKDGAAGMARFREEAEETTGVTAKQVEAFDTIGDAITRVWRSVKSIGASITEALFGDPNAIKEFAATFSAAAKGVRELVAANAPLIQGLGIAAAIITGVSLALGGLGLAAMAVSSGLKVIGTVFATVFTAKGFALTGIAAALIGVVGLLVKFGDVGKIFGGAWDSMLASVKTGQLELAFKIAFTAIKAEWHNLMVELSTGLAAAATIAAAGAMGAAKGGIPGSIAAGSAATAGLIAARMNALEGLEKAKAELEALKGQIKQGAAKAKEVFGGAGGPGGIGGPTKGGFGSLADLRNQLSIGDSAKPLDKIANNTERNAKATEKLLDKGGLVWAV